MQRYHFVFTFENSFSKSKALMHIIKLDAIDSTNTFLKELAANQYVENLTVVTTEHQTSGRGQRGSNWNTEPGKNLTFSILIRNFLLEIEQVYDLNVLITVSLHQFLSDLNLTNVAIKWPNDILSEKKKIAGVLIENQIKSQNEIVSIVGIGINVNQTNFEYLPHASSLQLLSLKNWNKEEILLSFIEKLKFNLNRFTNDGSHIFWKYYREELFLKNKPAVFEDLLNGRFMGMIKDVTDSGLLQVELENEKILNYSIKEIKLLY